MRRASDAADAHELVVEVLAADLLEVFPIGRQGEVISVAAYGEDIGLQQGQGKQRGADTGAPAFRFRQGGGVACGEALVVREAPLSYPGATFRVEVPCCPTCGQYFLPESVVLGKMAEVEQALEDK